MRAGLFIVLLISVIWGQSAINDRDAGSGQHGDLLDAAGTATQAISTASSTVDGVKVADKLAKDPVAEAKKMAVGAVAGAVVPYTNSKATVIGMVNKGLEKTREVVNRAMKRVDIWRTTKPTIERYHKSAGRLMDNTKGLFQDFTWKKFFSPKREWDKRREFFFDADKDGSNWRGAYVDYYSNVSGYLTDLYDANNIDRKKDVMNKTRAAMVPSLEAEMKTMPHLLDSDGNIDGNKIPGYDNIMIPYRALEYASQVYFVLKEIESEYSHPVGREGKIYPHSTVMIANMAEKLGSDKQTYLDSRELGAWIAEERMKVKLHTTRASQLQTQSQSYYANLYVRERERREVMGNNYEKSLQILAMGRESYEEYQKMLEIQSQAWGDRP